MYQRIQNRRQRYSPPPGYMGTAFGEGEEVPMEGKIHPAEHTEAPSRPEERPPEAEASGKKPQEAGGFPLPPALGELLEQLRGRIGAEELILLLVMLLLGADGAGAEVLLLALILLAG